MSRENSSIYPVVEFKLTHPCAKLPKPGREGDVGFDIVSPTREVLLAGKTTLIDSGLVLANMPVHIQKTNIFLKVEGRSGLSVKGIFPVGGIIDPTYRGNIGIVLHNSSDQDYVIAPGDRIAQLVVYYISAAPQIKMKDTNEVVDSIRGTDGFGSSGK